MKKVSRIIFSVLSGFGSALLGSHLAVANDLEFAPPAFTLNNHLVVPIDIDTVDVNYVFDAASSKVSATATVVFESEQVGFPMLDLVPTVTSVKLNGQTLKVTDFALVDDPDKVTKFRVLRSDVGAGARNTLELGFNFVGEETSFANDHVRSGFFSDDLTSTGRGFFEKYGPANFEFDHVKYKFNVRVINTTLEHEIFTNGRLTADGFNIWNVEFPDYFTTSSIFFHLTDKNRFKVQSFNFTGLKSSIPVTVYSPSASQAQTAADKAKKVMAELESTYGAFLHERLVIYVTSSMGGGMEYCGATMTDSDALSHELTHSWFARGVMPANGNAGWIDEAVASWRDNGYPRAKSGPNRSPVNLGGFSPYRRHTTRDAYTSGAKLISEFDFLFAAQGGMKTILRKLFDERKGTVITVAFLNDFLNSTTHQSLNEIFERYVYGRSFTADGKLVTAPEQSKGVKTFPRRYTAEELRAYR